MADNSDRSGEPPIGTPEEDANTTCHDDTGESGKDPCADDETDVMTSVDVDIVVDFDEDVIVGEDDGDDEGTQDASLAGGNALDDSSNDVVVVIEQEECPDDIGESGNDALAVDSDVIVEIPADSNEDDPCDIGDDRDTLVGKHFSGAVATTNSEYEPKHVSTPLPATGGEPPKMTDATGDEGEPSHDDDNGSERKRAVPKFDMRWVLVIVLILIAMAFFAASMIAGKGSSKDSMPVRTPESLPIVHDRMATEEPSPADVDEGKSASRGNDAQSGDTVRPRDSETRKAAQSKPVDITLVSIGDILLHMRVIESGLHDEGRNYDHLFSPIAGEIQAADIAVVNQETPIAGDAYGWSGYPSFNAPFEVGVAEIDSGFDVILKATNHTFDQGYAGISTELDQWEAYPQASVIGVSDPYDGNGISPSGGVSPAGPYVYEKDGFRVALLNYTDVLNANIDVSHDPQVLGIMDEERIRQDMAWAEEHADLTIVFAHWGEEYEEWPVDSERYWANLFVECGADAIIGGHPHVIQQVETLDAPDGRKVPIFWSVGNFVSTQTNNRNMIGIMACLKMHKDENGAKVVSYEGLPTVTHRGWGTDFAGWLLRDYTDELAWNNGINLIDPVGFSVEWCQSYCERILGEGYSRDTSSIGGTLS